MSKKTKPIILTVVIIAVLAGAYFLYNELGDAITPDNIAAPSPPPSENGEPVEQTKAPDFTVYDVDGAAVKLSDFSGKPVVLNFWASWCTPCKDEMPDFDLASVEHQDVVQFMMVNLTDGSRETVDSAKEYIAGQEFEFPVFFDTNIDAATVYGVTSIPTTYFIDSEGYLVTYAQGSLDAETLDYGISLILDAE